jgi:phosphatidylglycerophosphatase A
MDADMLRDRPAATNTRNLRVAASHHHRTSPCRHAAAGVALDDRRHHRPCGLAAAWGIIVCIRFGALAEEVFGRKDPNQVVTDEVTGQSLALLFLPWFPPEESARNLIIAGIGFLTFRTFDIVKPYPAYQLQRLRHGWGILLDDLVAGIYAAVVTQATVRLFVTP